MIAPIVLSRVLVRREDQLWIRFDFYNLTLDKSVAGAPVLRRTQPLQPAFMVVGLPPQHLAEEAFREPAPPDTLDWNDSTASDATQWPVGGRLAGPSRLAFALPAGVDTLPFTVDTLLRWGQFALSVAPTALARGAPPSPPPPLQAPLAIQTTIELPWRLLLSPHAGAGFAHALEPVTRGGRTELWHTRLGVALPGGTVDERDSRDRTLRAIWGADRDFAAWLQALGTVPAGGVIPAPGLPFRMPLTPKNRVEIVRATSDYAIPGFVPDPVDAERLMLSSLGGWLDVHGTWNPPPNVLAIQEWRHRATMGRDQHVRVVERGYLLPFGHAAVVVTVTDRKLSATPIGPQAAYLRQRLILIIRQPVKEYPAFAQGAGGRRFPFSRLTITTTTTPLLDGREEFVSQPAGTSGTAAFVPQVDGTPYEFHFVAEDLLGRRSEFTAPAVFVDSSTAFDEPSMATLRTAYNDAISVGDPLRRRPFDGQLLALAVGMNPGDTDVETSAITFAADAPIDGQDDSTLVAHNQPRCHPALAMAGIRLAAAEQLSGGALGPVDVTFDDTYITHGFDVSGNPGQVYAKLMTPVGLALSTDRAGPMTPGMTITALSRSLGPVGGDLETLRQGTYDTPAILDAAPTTPRILGGIKLSDIIPPVALSGGKAPDGAMVLTTETSNGSAPQFRSAQPLMATPDKFGPIIRFRFLPTPVPDPFGLLKFYPNTFCMVNLEIRVDYYGIGDSHYLFQGLLSNAPPYGLIADLPDPTETGPWQGKEPPAFTLQLLGPSALMVEVDFARFVMKFETGKDSYFNPVVGDVRFHGVLKFIEKLQQVLSMPSPPGAPKPRPILKLPPLSTKAIEVGVKAVFPTLTPGPFTLKNVMFGVSVLVPLQPLGADNTTSASGSMAVRLQFRFAERENPFLLSIYCFGGGGYLLMGFGTDWIDWLEIAFEFGLHAEGNIGIASGIIAIMAGIYFQLQQGGGPPPQTACILTGYFRMRGHVSVLGLVTITLEVYLGLTYQSVGNKVIGQATVMLDIQVLFFTMSVSFNVERQFSGDSQATGALRQGLRLPSGQSLSAGDHGPSFLDQIPAQELWNDYADAFAPVGG